MILPKEEIAGLLGKISPSPWEVVENKYGIEVACPGDSEGQIRRICHREYPDPQQIKDAEFIAQAPSIVRQLLREVKAYRQVAITNGHVCHSSECKPVCWMEKEVDQEAQRIMSEGKI